MNFCIFTLLQVLWGIGAAVASVDCVKPKIRTRIEFQSFAQDLGLPASKVQYIGDMYAETNTDSFMLEVACLTAQESLGGAKLDTRPLNQTIVDANW